MSRVAVAATLGVAAFSLLSCSSNENPAPAMVTPSASETTASTTSQPSSVVDTSSTPSNDTSSTAASSTSSQSATTTLEETSVAGTESTSADSASSSTTDSSNATGTETASSASTASDSAASSSTGTTSDGSMFRLTSPVLQWSAECTTTTPDACSIFPNENISYMDNANISPAFEWSGAPEGTLSFAITLKDLSFGQPLWAIWNIPSSETGLPADLPKDTTTLTTPAGAEQSNSTFATGEGYFGPESPCNVYQFELFALSTATYEPRDKEYAAEVDAQLNELGEVLGRTTLTARTKYDASCE